MALSVSEVGAHSKIFDLSDREKALRFFAVGALGLSSIAFLRLNRGEFKTLLSQSRMCLLGNVLLVEVAGFSMVALVHLVILRPLSRWYLGEAIHVKGMPPRFQERPHQGGPKKCFKDKKMGDVTVEVMRGIRKKKHSGKYLVVQDRSDAEYAGWGEKQWANLADKGWNVVRLEAEKKLEAVIEALGGREICIGVSPGQEGLSSDLPTLRIRDYTKSAAEWAEVEALACPVEARILRADESADPRGALIFVVPKSKLFQDYAVSDFQELVAAGYNCVVYNPPGYGLTPGLRIIEDETWAINAVLNAVKKLGWQESEITVIGYSLGSGAACAAGAEHRLKGLCLVVPLDDTPAVIRRWMHRKLGALGPAGSLVTVSLTETYYEYDNVRALGSCKASSLLIVEAKQDEMMRGGPIDSAAKRLKSAWPKEKGLRSIALDGGHTARHFYEPRRYLEWIGEAGAE